MRKNIILILLIFISTVLFSEAIYNGNISVVENDFFSGYVIDEPGVYAGGSNTFPIGSYVEVKLPHSESKVSVKIVRRIPETGRFILVDENAGNQLGLTKDDVVLVSVVVTKFIPNPSEELESFTPEPEIKGFTSDIVNTKDETTEDGIEGISDEIPGTTAPTVPAATVAPVPVPGGLDTDSDELNTEDIFPEDEVEEDGPIIEDTAVVVEGSRDDSLEEEIDNTLYDDIEDSMFSEVPELEEETEEYDDKIVKRVYFLEPANSKPPVGGIPDKDLIPVTKNDISKEFKDGYYLQVGIYSDDERLKNNQNKLDEYSLPYLSVKKEKGDKKNLLLVGPLTNDEQGVIMLYLKDKGFYDFFKYKKKQ